MIRFSGCKSGSACTIILRGASSHLLDEAERSLHDALCVLTETVKETRCGWCGVCVNSPSLFFLLIFLSLLFIFDCLYFFMALYLSSHNLLPTSSYTPLYLYLTLSFTFYCLFLPSSTSFPPRLSLLSIF